MAIKFIPSHVNETAAPVDNRGGLFSLIFLGTLILAINFAPVPNAGTLILGFLIIAAISGIMFIMRQRRVKNPLYDLKVASRSIFWVAACAGIIVFGLLWVPCILVSSFYRMFSATQLWMLGWHFTSSSSHDF
jgi:hypothetical protein